MATQNPRRTQPANPLALEEQVCFALSVGARAVIAVYKPVLAPMGLTHPQYLVMLALWEFEPLSVKALAAAIQLDSATLSPLLKRLESRGLLTRERKPDDERTLSVALTAKGRDLRKQALNVPPTILSKLG